MYNGRGFQLKIIIESQHRGLNFNECIDELLFFKNSSWRTKAGKGDEKAVRPLQLRNEVRTM